MSLDLHEMTVLVNNSGCNGPVREAFATLRAAYEELLPKPVRVVATVNAKAPELVAAVADADVTPVEHFKKKGGK